MHERGSGDRAKDIPARRRGASGTNRAASTGPRELLTGARLLSSRVLPGAVLTFCAASCARLIAEQAGRFFLLGPEASCDLYVFHTVRLFQKTGVIYQDLARELPALYGPMLYVLLAIPGRLVTGGNPLLGPRLIVITAFLLCVALAASITRVLMPHRKVWLWSVPLALSFGTMSPWVLQLRGDFPAIMFNLLAVRLLLARKSGAALMAGACAGFATQFKFIYVAALGAGFLWLVANRRWRAAACFTLAGAVTSAGIYGVFVWREPRLLDNVLALRRFPSDYAGAASIIYHSLREPVALLGVSAALFLRWGIRSRWTLLGLFAGLSFGMSAIGVVQVGADSNYFFEFFLALAPLAALGVWKSRRLAFGVTAVWLSALLLICLAAPIAAAAFTAARTWPEETRAQNLDMTALQRALRDQSVLAFVPRVAFFTPEVVMSEPIAASLYERLGIVDLHPLAGRIRSQRFDLVVTPKARERWRGVDWLSPTLRSAIEEEYRPFCTMKDWVMSLRRSPTAKGALSERLVALGCDSTACLSGPLCRSW